MKPLCNPVTMNQGRRPRILYVPPKIGKTNEEVNDETL